MGETIDEVLKHQGADPPPLSLDCRHGTQKVQFKLYDRVKLNKKMETIEGMPADHPPDDTSSA